MSESQELASVNKIENLLSNKSKEALELIQEIKNITNQEQELDYKKRLCTLTLGSRYGFNIEEINDFFDRIDRDVLHKRLEVTPEE